MSKSDLRDPVRQPVVSHLESTDTRAGSHQKREQVQQSLDASSERAASHLRSEPKNSKTPKNFHHQKE